MRLLPKRIERTPRGSALFYARLREANAATAQPQLQRGGDNDGDNDGDETPDSGSAHATKQCPTCKGGGLKSDGTPCPRCEGKGTVGTAGSAGERTPLHESHGALVQLTATHEITPTSLREAASSTATAPVFEVEILSEGLGNNKDRVLYTRQALKEAADRGVFNGMQCYANHQDADEERTRPERDVRQLVGYYRNCRFTESGGKGVVKGELVVIPGEATKWFVELCEAAIAAKRDGVQLVGVSINGGGLVEYGEAGGQMVNICREIQDVPSADVVTKAERGTIVRRLRESAARTSLPKPKEAPMKFDEYKSKLGAAHAKLRESTETLRKEDATEDDVAKALKGIGEAETEIETLQGTEIEQPEAAAPAAEETEVATLTSKLQESQKENDELKGKVVPLERSLLAAAVLREANVPEEDAKRIFDELLECSDEDAMKARLKEAQAADDRIVDKAVQRFRESFAPTPVEGAGARVPTVPTSAPAPDQLGAYGIPSTPEPAAAA